jgi:Na+-transporting NADH:ubiquinone oxidoreductase subunit NqrF
MRRIKFQDEEYLIHTRSGHRLLASMKEQGIAVNCQCAKGNYDNCKVKFPQDTAFLLVSPTALEKKVFTKDELDQGMRLACQALWK